MNLNQFTNEKYSLKFFIVWILELIKKTVFKTMKNATNLPLQLQSHIYILSPRYKHTCKNEYSFLGLAFIFRKCK